MNILPYQSLQFDQNHLAALTEENESLRKQVQHMEGEAKKWVMLHKSFEEPESVP